MKVIKEFVSAMLDKYRFPSHEGISFTSKDGISFVAQLRNEEILELGKKACGKQFPELRLALNAADVVFQFVVSHGKLDATKSVFPCRGFVSTSGNDAITKVLEAARKNLARLLGEMQGPCLRLYQAGALSKHHVREIVLGNTRVVFVEEPCPEFSLGWFLNPGDTLDALLSGARFFNLKVEVYRQGKKLSQRTIEGVVDGAEGDIHSIERSLLRDAAMEARMRSIGYVQTAAA